MYKVRWRRARYPIAERFPDVGADQRRSPNSPLKKSIRATAGPCGRNTALRSLAESLDSTRLRALSSATMARPRLQSDFINGLLIVQTEVMA